MAAAADQADVRSHAIEREHYERILSVTRRLASTSDLQEVLGTIIDALKIVLRADRASVFQYDAETHELFATRAHGLAADLRLPADRGIIGEAARTRLIVNIPDAYADARFNQEVDSKTGYRTRCLLTVPLMDYEGKLVGVAQVLNKDIEWGGIFVVEDEVLAQHLADQAAMALKRAALLDAERQKHKLEADLQVAKRIQQASLPASLPAIPGYSIAADTLPADETGGDAFDVIDLRKWKGENAHADAMIFLADATGHGIGPALSITQAASMVRMGCRIGASLDEIALHVNNQLCTDLP
ncbi:MAG TPA: GAF domain-containing protein, partial [Phycisphaerales bacterium]|nr:GAF domain-containing protein [Phycisphaerales bacterium]